MIFVFCKLLGNLVLFSEMFLTNDKACTKYNFFFIAIEITLKILWLFPTLVNTKKSQGWDKLIFAFLSGHEI